MTPEIFYLILLVALSAFFSGSETAMFSLSRIYLKKLENTGGRRENLVIKLLSRPRKLLVTLLLCNTFVNIALSSFSTVLAYNMAKAQHWDMSLVITLQIIIDRRYSLFWRDRTKADRTL